MTHEELVEEVARQMAVANNGGDWASHYTEEQKDEWRDRATAIVALILLHCQPGTET